MYEDSRYDGRRRSKMGGLGEEGTFYDCESTNDPEGIDSSDAYLRVVFDFAQDRCF